MTLKLCLFLFVLKVLSNTINHYLICIVIHLLIPGVIKYNYFLLFSHIKNTRYHAQNTNTILDNKDLVVNLCFLLKNSHNVKSFCICVIEKIMLIGLFDFIK